MSGWQLALPLRFPTACPSGRRVDWQNIAKTKPSSSTPPRLTSRSQPKPAAPAKDDTDMLLDRLQRLGELHNSGVLTDDEFTAQKAKILG